MTISFRFLFGNIAKWPNKDQDIYSARGIPEKNFSALNEQEKPPQHITTSG